MTTHRRTILAAGLAAGLAHPPAYSQSFPSGIIRFIIPTQPGGGHDTMMRLIGQKLTDRLGQPCIVESRPGASGAIAAQTVARAAPDGHTLLLGFSAFLSNLVLMPRPGYRMREFAPICMMALTPIALGVNEDAGVATLSDYVALAQAHPGSMSYASYGQGSGGHFVGELLNVAAGIDTLHIPYKGEAPALLDLVAGHVKAAYVSIGGTKRYPGKVRTIAIASAERSPSYPDVPTFAELGYPSVDMPGWAALFAPTGTPQSILDRLTQEINRIVMLPDVKPKLAELGFDSAGWEPRRMQTFFQEQFARTSELVNAGRVKL